MKIQPIMIVDEVQEVMSRWSEFAKVAVVSRKNFDSIEKIYNKSKRV